MIVIFKAFSKVLVSKTNITLQMHSGDKNMKSRIQSSVHHVTFVERKLIKGSYLLFLQSRSQSLQAFWSAVGRQERVAPGD